MADHCFCLDELYPTEALQVLAMAAERTGVRYMDEIRVRVFKGTFGPQVTIFVPDAYVSPGKREEREARQRTFGTVIEAYVEVRGKEPSHGLVSGNSLPLLQGVVWLLFNSFSGKDEEPAPKIEQEYLVIGRGVDESRAIEIKEDLRFHATHTRIATVKAKGGTELIFLHVLDDHQRCSSFLSMVAGDVLSEWSILDCFRHQELSVFLPQGIQPGSQGLAHFCRLVQAVPSLFSLRSSRIEPGLLVAIDQRPSPGDEEEPLESRFALMPLVGLRFHSQVGFTPRTIGPAEFEVHDLESSEDMLSRLREAIAEEEPYVGYCLELRPTRYREPVGDERRRLRERQVEIEYKLAFLDSIEQPRPTLLRFTQRQLPALADVIRSFPGRVIREGVLKYGFQATDHDAGLHFILVEPQYAVMTELDPLLWWQDLYDRPMRFWLDPYWARYYYGQGNECLVFVPEGTTLFPPMHDWDVGSMDQYMRDIMGHWFHGHYGVARIPDKPIYVFDGETHPGADLYISVLDRANMRPLRTRLGWLNDNLTIMDAVGVERFVQEMAGSVTRQALAQTIQQEANKVEKAFGEKARETSESIAAKTTDLTEAVSRALARVVKETEKTIKEIEALDRRLRELWVSCAKMKKESAQGEKLMARTEKESKEVKSVFEKLDKKVGLILQETEKSRKRMEGEIRQEIAELRYTRDRLLRELDDLRKERQSHAELERDSDTTVHQAD